MKNSHNDDDDDDGYSASSSPLAVDQTGSSIDDIELFSSAFSSWVSSSSCPVHIFWMYAWIFKIVSFWSRLTTKEVTVVDDERWDEVVERRFRKLASLASSRSTIADKSLSKNERTRILSLIFCCCWFWGCFGPAIFLQLPSRSVDEILLVHCSSSCSCCCGIRKLLISGGWWEKQRRTRFFQFFET